MCFAAYQMKIPECYDIEEEKALKAKQYYSLLKTPDGNTLPDPFEMEGWLTEKDAITKWPKCTNPDLSCYLLTIEDRSIGRRLLNDYKVRARIIYLSVFRLVQSHVKIVTKILTIYKLYTTISFEGVQGL